MRLFFFFLLAVVEPASSVEVEASVDSPSAESVMAMAPRTGDIGSALLSLPVGTSSSSKSVCVAIVLLVRVGLDVAGVDKAGVADAESSRCVSAPIILGESTSLEGLPDTDVAQISQMWGLTGVGGLAVAAHMTTLFCVIYGTLL